MMLPPEIERAAQEAVALAQTAEQLPHVVIDVAGWTTIPKEIEQMIIAACKARALEIMNQTEESL